MITSRIKIKIRTSCPRLRNAGSITRVGIGFFGVTSVDQVDALLNTVKYAPMKFDLESI
jgi:hypothetical protein